MKAMVIINPSSGKELAKNYEKMIADSLSRTYSEIVSRHTEKAGDAEAFAKEACDGSYDTIISMGGDGTINETINGMAEQQHRPKLGIIPLGTINDFARAIGVPLDPEEAIAILDQSATKPVDIGKINQSYFANVIAIGSIAEATYNVTPTQKTRLGSLAYFMEGAKSFLSSDTITVKMEHDSGTWQGECFLMLAALTNSVGGFESLAPEAEVNDGKLHVFIVKQVSIPKIAKIIPSLLKGELKESEEVDYIRTTALTVSSPKEHIINIDGEEGGSLPFTANVLPRHLNVIVPGK